MLRTPVPESVELVSFDGGVAARCDLLRPDRYWMIESADGRGPRIARGGGYSYAAASFGAGSLVLDMTRFDRVLGLDEASRTVHVEAGATLGDLLALTGPRGLLLSVQPGYPAITVGGCIAANVHGKNPHREGTFAELVESLTLFHPDRGTVELDRAKDPDLFELTCGGYGLTGLILAARLRLSPVEGFAARVERVEVRGLRDGLAAVRSLAEGSAFAYTWHDGVPRPATFGRGFVYRGTIVAGAPFPNPPPRYRRRDAAARRLLPVSVLGGSAAMALTRGFWSSERLKGESNEVPLFDAMFPFARRFEYFLLYGRRGLAEFQAILPHDVAEDFLAELEKRLLRDGPPSVMISMKLFRGERRLLRFEGEGVCLTVDFARSGATTRFLSTLDSLCAEAGALPNIIKDSRLPREVVRVCYPQLEEFREKLHAFDPARLFRSELSQRLGI